MMDAPIDDGSRESKTDRGIERMSERDQTPAPPRPIFAAMKSRNDYGVAPFILFFFSSILGHGRCSDEFDQIGDEEMAGDQQIEQAADQKVAGSIIVTSDTDENPILQSIIHFALQSRYMIHADYLDEILDHQT